MPRSYEEIRQIAIAHPEDQRLLLAESLWESATPETRAAGEAQWREEVGEPEPGYDKWFRAGVKEALADTSGDVPHEEVVQEVREFLHHLETEPLSR